MHRSWGKKAIRYFVKIIRKAFQLYRSERTSTSVVMSSTQASGSVTENRIVLVDQMKRNAVSIATFFNDSKLLNFVIYLL